MGGNLLAGLSERQWQDAFRAGGYNPEVSARFIRKISSISLPRNRYPSSRLIGRLGCV